VFLNKWYATGKISLNFLLKTDNLVASLTWSSTVHTSESGAPTRTMLCSSSSLFFQLHITLWPCKHKREIYHRWLHITQNTKVLQTANKHVNVIIHYTHTDRQSVDISFTVCLFVFVILCVCTVSPPRIKLVESNFARQFIGVLGRESPISGNFSPQKPKIGRIEA